MVQKKDKILFVCPKLASFIKLDIEILSEIYDVEVNLYNWKIKKSVPFYFIKQLFFLTLNFYKYKQIIVSFGGYWALLPSLFGYIFKKKVFIILHGTDCAHFPEINYGALRKPLLRLCCKWSYTMAYKLLPVSKSLIYTENSYFKREFIIKQGCSYFFPRIKTPSEVIPNGFEIEKWISNNENIAREKNSFITVLSSKSQFLRKGVDLILEVSEKHPNLKFYIIGIKDIGSIQYPNVSFLGKLSQEELKTYYYRSEFYLQLSVFEGFGCALCEAMLCGCIPIGSNVNAIPDIIGDTGYILDHRDVIELDLLLKNIRTFNIQSEKIKQQIITHYSVEYRKQLLMKSLNS